MCLPGLLGEEPCHPGHDVCLNDSRVDPFPVQGHDAGAVIKGLDSRGLDWNDVQSPLNLMRME